MFVEHHAAAFKRIFSPEKLNPTADYFIDVISLPSTECWEGHSNFADGRLAEKIQKP
jgi:hypothetical protein